MAPPAARVPSAGSSRWTDDPVLTPPSAAGLGRRDSAGGSQVAGGDEDGSIHSFHMSETMNSTRGAAAGGGRQAHVSGSGVPADAASLLPAPRGTGKWTSDSPETTLRGGATGTSRLGPATAAVDHGASDGPSGGKKDDDFWDADEDAIQVSH